MFGAASSWTSSWARSNAMTTQEWLTCTTPKDMLKWLGRSWRRRLTRWCGIAAGAWTRRKLRLFAGACCVRSTQGLRIAHWDDELRNLVALGKGEIEVEQFESFLSGERHASVAPETWALWRAESAGKHRGIAVAWDTVNHETETGDAKGLDWDNVMSEWAEERKAQCDLFARFRLARSGRTVARRTPPAWHSKRWRGAGR